MSVQNIVNVNEANLHPTLEQSMTTPVLFVIAEDLTKMELQVKVDEADVSTVKLGQPASFTVSAWPGRSFPATIQRVGLGSTTTDNVVTYKTVLSVANDDLALRPGMTATSRILTTQRDDVLLVPNAALRFKPAEADEAAADKGGEKPAAASGPGGAPRNGNAGDGKGRGKKREGNNGRVYVVEGRTIKPVQVQIGITDNRNTEIVGGVLADECGQLLSRFFAERRKAAKA